MDKNLHLQPVNAVWTGPFPPCGVTPSGRYFQI